MFANRQIVSMVIVLLCVAAFWIIPSQTNDGRSGFATGASLLPDMAVTLVLVFSLLDLFLLTLRRNRQGDDQATDVSIGRPQLLALAAVVGGMALYALTLESVGYFVASALLLAGLMVCIGARDRTQITIVTALSVAVLYLGMRYGLDIRLPTWPRMMLGA